MMTTNTDDQEREHRTEAGTLVTVTVSELAELLAIHHQQPATTPEVCLFCGEPWSCRTRRAVETLMHILVNTYTDSEPPDVEGPGDSEMRRRFV